MVVTSKDGVFVESNNTLAPKVDGLVFGDDIYLYNGIQASDGYYYLVSPNGGLFVFNESFQPLANYKEQHNLGANALSSVLEDDQNNIWISGIPSITKMIPTHKYSAFKPGTQSTIIDRLVPIDGKMLATGDGVFQLNSSVVTQGPAAFEPIISSTAIYFDALEYADHLLYAGAGGVFARPIGNSKLKFQNILTTGWGRSLKIDPVTGLLVAGTYEGLFILALSDDGWSYQKVANTEDELEFVAIEDNGVIWAGTTSQELYRIENAQFETQTTKVKKFIAEDGLGPGNVMPFKLSSGVVMATSNGLLD